MYFIRLIDSHGNSSFLSVKGKTEWKTKKSAINHAKGIKECIDKGLNIWDTVVVHVEDENERLIWS